MFGRIPIPGEDGIHQTQLFLNSINLRYCLLWDTNYTDIYDILLMELLEQGFTMPRFLYISDDHTIQEVWRY